VLDVLHETEAGAVEPAGWMIDEAVAVAVAAGRVLARAEGTQR
jgi:hypothetical protein